MRGYWQGRGGGEGSHHGWERLMDRLKRGQRGGEGSEEEGEEESWVVGEKGQRRREPSWRGRAHGWAWRGRAHGRAWRGIKRSGLGGKGGTGNK